MGASFPTSIKVFTVHHDYTDIIWAAIANELQDEVVAIENALGSVVEGTYSNVRSRIEHVETFKADIGHSHNILPNDVYIGADHNVQYSVLISLNKIQGMPPVPLDVGTGALLQINPFGGDINMGPAGGPFIGVHIYGSVSSTLGATFGGTTAMNTATASTGFFTAGAVQGGGGSFSTVNAGFLAMTGDINASSHAVFAGAFVTSSSIEHKRDVDDSKHGMKALLQLRPVSFRRKDMDNTFHGFVAEEVQAFLPDAVVTISNNGEVSDDNDVRPKIGIHSDTILAVAIKAIQELKAEVNDLREELETFKRKKK